MSDTVTWSCPSCRDKDAEIDRLRQRVAELEAHILKAREKNSVLFDAIEEWDDWEDDQSYVEV